MWRQTRSRTAPPTNNSHKLKRGSVRDRVAMLLALITAAVLGGVFLFSPNMTFLMPGPLTSAHGTIENCSACHTKSGSGKLSWLHGLVAGDRLADSKACLACHRMPDTGLNPHGASVESLQMSTQRLRTIAAGTPAPRSASAQNIAFPTDKVIARGLYCTTCHQEHRGKDFKLGKISNEQCGSCHVVKFDSFDGHHPNFENYPFRRRTRIIYDHAGHFDKHFPDMASKDSTKRVPATCSTCHESSKDRRVMGVAPFAQTCTACHLDQIVGNERVSGPKGIALLTLPGLDLQTLKMKNAAIGEWPGSSEEGVTPFMKVMIGWDERGRALVESVGRLNLQDLTNASDEQIGAVTALVWEIKRIFHALTKEKASDVLARLELGGKKQLGEDLLADLTASIPRDVIVSAQQQWLPNLAVEMASRPDANNKNKTGWSTIVTQSTSSAGGEGSNIANSGRPSAPREPPESQEGPGVSAVTGRAAQAEGTVGAEARAPGGQPPKKSADQTDDLLHPTKEELRAMKGGANSANKAAQPGGDGRKVEEMKAKPGSTDVASGNVRITELQARATPAASIESNVDPENWAAYGGWYRQDYAILYRPAGHKDRFIQAWLRLAGPLAMKGDGSPASAVFDHLTRKDAQGACTKCHSVDDVPGKGRIVNFAPLVMENKQERFTHFIHEPHFSVLETRGCLACHGLEKGDTYLRSYEQGNPKSFSSNFGGVKKDLCQTCHTGSMARQDCLLCHKYHVNGTVTPIMDTKIPGR